MKSKNPGRDALKHAREMGEVMLIEGLDYLAAGFFSLGFRRLRRYPIIKNANPTSIPANWVVLNPG